MKIKFFLLTMAAALMAGCSEELDRGDDYKLEKGISATIPAYTFDAGTRVNISDDLQSFTWSDGDKLGLYYQGSNSSAYAGFIITSGGGSTGHFENEAFILKKSSTYYAFYPFNDNATIASAPVDFTGQAQNGNGSAAHLGGYNYMYSTLNTDAGGNASIQFKNLGAVMQLRLTVSNAATYTGIDITSDGTNFITKGTASMVDGSVTASETSATIHLALENGIALNADDVLIANILVAPVDMSGSNLTITLTDEDENTYEVTTEGKNMLQGKAYLYAETVPNTGDIPYVTFTADAEQTLQMSKAVPTLEYSVNGGSWTALGTSKVTFGGDYGNLCLRGKSSLGTIESEISFGNETKVACSGDIRTLIDYENYTTVSTHSAKFSKLFMFCSQLISAPELPATTLAAYCYEQMFRGCTSLTQAPGLPAISLAAYCYGNMFQGCTSLTQAPELPATTLADNCYVAMFCDCTSLTQAPGLPATTLAAYCYNFMFRGCTSLTQAPELSATTLAELCCYFMFSGCTSLTQAPELLATTLTERCYEEMFSGCTSLTQAPELPATTLAAYCYYKMFSGCTSLTQAPELPATTLATYCYEQMFRGCTSLTQAPELPATTLATYCYEQMFYDCTSLTQAPVLPATTLTERCYVTMFSGCTSLTQAPELPATTLAKDCYGAMFQGCTSLTQAPELPATTLANHCYFQMFCNCSNLNYIKMMATDISDIGSLSIWVMEVSSTGTFVKNKDATWSFTGNSGIPSGWTTIYYDTDNDKYYLDQACTQECDDHGNPL